MTITTDELKQLLITDGARADLHLHSNASDGKLSPAEVVAAARERGVVLLALTDHDTCDGIKEAVEAVQACTEHNVHMTTGIEISTIWRGREIHIVGLCFDPNHPAMTFLLEKQKKLRDDRARAIGEKLEKCGFKDAYQKTREMAGNTATITRGNYTAYLYSVGAAETMNQCFAKYLAEGRKAYVRAQWCSVEDAVNAVNLAGGIAVLAHPRSYDLNNKWLRMLITDFKNAGGEAVEVSGSLQSPADRDFLQVLSVEYELFASCGSDFHRECKYISIGGGGRLPDRVNPVWNHKKFKLEV